MPLVRTIPKNCTTSLQKKPVHREMMGLFRGLSFVLTQCDKSMMESLQKGRL